MEVLPGRCVPIAKRELLWAGSAGLACWLAGVIFIDRKRTGDAISVMSEVAQTLLSQDVSHPGDEGEVWSRTVVKKRTGRVKGPQPFCSPPRMCLLRQVRVWVFPEGTRNHNGSMLPFKRGAFHLAVQAQVMSPPSAAEPSPAPLLSGGAPGPPEGARADGFSLPQVPIVPIVMSSYQDFYCKKERRFTSGEALSSPGGGDQKGHGRG